MKKEVLRINDLCADRMTGCCLQHICLHLYEGEVLGIIGLHDAGKSFLFDCIMGKAKIKNGMIFFQEERREWDYAVGRNEVYRISKHSSLVENCTVLENLLILRKRTHYFGVISWRKLQIQIKICLQEFDIKIDPNTTVENLSLEQRNEIEILKAYILGSRLILFDDILYMYRPGDYSHLYELISKMQKKGISFLMSGCQIEKISIFTERCLLMVNGWSVKTVENIRRDKIDEVELMLRGGFDEKNEDGRLLENIEKHHQIYKEKEKRILAEISYDKTKRIEITQGEIVVFLDINHREEEKLKDMLQCDKRIYSGNVEIENRVWKKGSEVCVTDFLNTQPLIGSLSLCDNLCLALFSRISRMGFISRKKTAVVEKFFLEQYANRGWTEVNGVYIPFAKEVAVFLERLKLQKWKLMFCFNLENIMTYELENMIKEQIIKMTEGKRSVCIFASSLEKFKDFPDYYLIAQENGKIGKYTYQELRAYLGV